MFHTIIIAGNLGKDPEMRYTPSGEPVTNFNVASTRKYTGADGNLVEDTIWFRISVWGKQAESCNNYLKKGRPVLVEGVLVPDKKTGGPRIWQGQNGPGASFEVRAVTVRFLPGRSDAGRDDAGTGAGDFASGPQPSDSDGDIPF